MSLLIKLVHPLMLLKSMQTFNEDFLRHHAEVALKYVRIVEKESRRARQADRVWFRKWQEELSKSTI